MLEQARVLKEVVMATGIKPPPFKLSKEGTTLK